MQLGTLTDNYYIEDYVKQAEFITPKLQRTALAAEETKGPIKIMLDLGRCAPEERGDARLLGADE